METPFEAPLFQNSSSLWKFELDLLCPEENLYENMRRDEQIIRICNFT